MGNEVLPLLRQGDRGEAVLRLQKLLGFGPGGQTALFGPSTEEALAVFQRGHGLQADGVVGPLTWAALTGPHPGPSDLGRRAAEIAMAYVGEHEVPLGSNRGPFVDMLNAEIGAPLGSYWCMSFVQHCVKRAAGELGVPLTLARTASCSALYAWARANGKLVPAPIPGDIFLCIGGEHGHYHTGFVTHEPALDRFETVEGNSNQDGSANGIEVAHRMPGRRVSSCHYVRP